MKKNKAKKTKTATVNVGSLVIDAASLKKMVDRIKKLVPKAEKLTIDANSKRLFLMASYSEGRVRLTSSKAVEGGTGVLLFDITPSIFASAINYRGKLKFEVKDNDLEIASSNYKGSLHIEPVEEIEDIKLSTDLDSKPLLEVMEHAPGIIDLFNHIEGIPLDVSIRWSKGRVSAGAADNHHGILVEGPSETKKSGEIVLPSDMIKRLADFGGEIGLDKSTVSVIANADDERSEAEMARIAIADSFIPLDSIQGLKKEKESGMIVLDAAEVVEIVTNISSVTEWGPNLAIALDKKKATFSSSGRYGKMQASVEIHKKTGTIPAKIMVSPYTLTGVLANFSGMIRLEFCSSILRILPLEKSEWQKVGFMSRTQE